MNDAGRAATPLKGIEVHCGGVRGDVRRQRLAHACAAKVLEPATLR